MPESRERSRLLKYKLVKIEPLDTMVAYALCWPEDEPLIACEEEGFYVLSPHTEPFEDSESPMVAMRYGRLLALVEDLVDMAVDQALEEGLIARL